MLEYLSKLLDVLHFDISSLDFIQLGIFFNIMLLEVSGVDVEGNEVEERVVEKLKDTSEKDEDVSKYPDAGNGEPDKCMKHIENKKSSSSVSRVSYKQKFMIC